jgi:CubicO group peptidase (beta-lactamase class C family)
VPTSMVGLIQVVLAEQGSPNLHRTITTVDYHAQMSKIVTVLAFAILMGRAIAASADSPNDDRARFSLAQGFITAFNASDAAGLRTRLTDDGQVAAVLKQRQAIGELRLKGIIDAGPRQTSLLASSAGGTTYRVILWYAPQSTTQLSHVDFVPALAPPVVSGPVSEVSFVKQLNPYIANAATRGFFSGAVLVAKNGVPIFSRAYGMASIEYGVANTPHTLFNIGSIGKLFTKVAIGQLMQQGKLSGSDTIGKWLPDYPNQAAKAATIQQLVDMSSGIGDIFTQKFERTPPGDFRSLEDYLQTFATDPLSFAPGTGNQYSNGGYLVLGLIIQKASGENYYEYVAKHIFESAGMTNTQYPFADAVMHGRATGYTSPGPGESQRMATFMEPARGSSAGGAFSTASDILRFAVALRSAKLLNPTYTKWAVPPGPSYGVAGGTPGWNALLDMEFDSNYTVVVLANIDPPAAEDLGLDIVRWTRHIIP